MVKAGFSPLLGGRWHCVIQYGMWVSRSGEAKLMLTATHCLLTYMAEMYQNGWTDHDAVWVAANSHGPREQCIDWVQIPPWGGALWRVHVPAHSNAHTHECHCGRMCLPWWANIFAAMRGDRTSMRSYSILLWSFVTFHISNLSIYHPPDTQQVISDAFFPANLSA